MLKPSMQKGTKLMHNYGEYAKLPAKSLRLPKVPRRNGGTWTRRNQQSSHSLQSMYMFLTCSAAVHGACSDAILYGNA